MISIWISKFYKKVILINMGDLNLGFWVSQIRLPISSHNGVNEVQKMSFHKWTNVLEEISLRTLRLQVGIESREVLFPCFLFVLNSITIPTLFVEVVISLLFLFVFRITSPKKRIRIFLIKTFTRSK